jgi:predicted S18 family serine protease
MKTDRILAILLAISLLANIGLILFSVPYEQGQIAGLINRTNTLSMQNMQLQEMLNTANLSLQRSSGSLDFYRSQLAQNAGGLTADRLGITGTASMVAPAVSQSVQLIQNGPFIERIVVLNGSVMNISVTAQPGKGRVLVETTPLMGIVFQDAANTAVAVAQNRTRADLAGTDIFFSIRADEEISAIDGPSAGALMTLLTIAALEHRAIDPDITLTGTIDRNGHIGAIGGAVEKATAAKQDGITRFLIPRENSDLTIYDQREVNYRGFQLIDYVPRTVEARTYIMQNVGITVDYVDFIDDVTAIALK